MRSRWVMLTLLFAWLCISPALAKETKGGKKIPVVVRLELLQLTDQQMAKLDGKSRVKKVDSSKVLVSNDMLVATGSEALTHLGGKNPIIYYDPRAQQFQVQYVDTGMKLDVVIRKAGTGVFSVEVRPEISITVREDTYGPESYSATYQLTAVFITEQTIRDVNYQEKLVLGRLTGPAAREFLTNLGQTATTDNLVCTLELERPQ